MSRDDRYRVGIYADWHNPDSIPNYKAKIVSGTTFIMLPQYPSPRRADRPLQRPSQLLR